ncbi:putative bifunctional riboflavin biosynthesis protein RIBA 2, chloroplastic [Chlamydiales bacterium STE3]|nr:putative bifunctional riboflavin biosynthesis protein RIBA 2, chloroplastic [Chlamydiales bacterium STE3]
MNCNVEKALEDLRNGKLIIVTDDEGRENEGDLMIAAEKVTPEAIAFMIRHTSGIICLPLSKERLKELQLPQMVAENTDPRLTAFTISVDAQEGITTGISARDRSHSIKMLIDPSTKPEQLRRPGHIFPLQSREGGVLKRAGHTEAGVDLAQMAGLYPSCALAEVVNDDGTVAKFEELKALANAHNLTIVTIEEIIRYRRKREKLITCVSEAKLPTEFGLFKAYIYESSLDGIQHVALVKGDVRDQQNVLVRVHSECLTGDIFGSKRCDCGTQLSLAMKKIEEEGTGVLIYLRGHEGRGIGLGHKLRAYHLQDLGLDTVEANLELGFPADSREYGIGAQMLVDLGITTIRLMTNNPAKYSGLSGYNLKITERVPLLSNATQENRNYLLAKKEKLGHFIDMCAIDGATK